MTKIKRKESLRVNKIAIFLSDDEVSQLIQLQALRAKTGTMSNKSEIVAELINKEYGAVNE